MQPNIRPHLSLSNMYAHSPIEFSHPLTVHIHPLLGTHSDLLVIYEQTA